MGGRGGRLCKVYIIPHEHFLRMVVVNILSRHHFLQNKKEAIRSLHCNTLLFGYKFASQGVFEQYLETLWLS